MRVRFVLIYAAHDVLMDTLFLSGWKIKVKDRYGGIYPTCFDIYF